MITVILVFEKEQNYRQAHRSFLKNRLAEVDLVKHQSADVVDKYKKQGSCLDAEFSISLIRILITHKKASTKM